MTCGFASKVSSHRKHPHTVCRALLSRPHDYCCCRDFTFALPFHPISSLILEEYRMLVPWASHCLGLGAGGSKTNSGGYVVVAYDYYHTFGQDEI
jgi:hypothetical protein